MVNKIKLGLRLRRLRNLRKITLRELAGLTGLTTSFLSQVENGKTSPSIDSIIRIARALNVSVVEFFEEGISESGLSTKRRPGKTVDKETGSSYEEFISNLPEKDINPLLVRLQKGGRVNNSTLHAKGDVYATVMEGRVELALGAGSTRNRVVAD